MWQIPIQFWGWPLIASRCAWSTEWRAMLHQRTCFQPPRRVPNTHSALASLYFPFHPSLSPAAPQPAPTALLLSYEGTLCKFRVCTGHPSPSFVSPLPGLMRVLEAQAFLPMHPQSDAPRWIPKQAPLDFLGGEVWRPASGIAEASLVVSAPSPSCCADGCLWTGRSRGLGPPGRASVSTRAAGRRRGGPAGYFHQQYMRIPKCL